MSKVSLLSLFLGLLLSIAVSNVSAKIVQRIIGGKYATYGFKYQVSLQKISPSGCSYHFCGGSILDSWHIITAAHCVTKRGSTEFSDSKITVVAGTTRLNQKVSYPALYHDVDYIFIPNTYEPFQPIHDIAILRLKERLPLRDDARISAINLPTPNQYQPPSSILALMSGFGSYYQTPAANGKLEASPGSPILKYAYGHTNKIEAGRRCLDTQVCVEGMNKTRRQLEGTCFGDSGGPLVDPATNTLIGITSGSFYDQCGVQTNFTRVSSFLDFIRKVKQNDVTNIAYKKLNHVQKHILPTLRHCDN